MRYIIILLVIYAVFVIIKSLSDELSEIKKLLLEIRDNLEKGGV